MRGPSTPLLPRARASSARTARGGWQYDAATFSRWLATFDDACRTRNLLSPARLPLELLDLLQSDPPASQPVRLCSSPALTAFSPSSAPSSTPGAPGSEASHRRRPPPRSTSTKPPTTKPNSPPAPSGLRTPACRQPRPRILVVTQDATDPPRRNRARLSSTSPPLRPRPALRVLSRHPAQPGRPPPRRASASALALHPARRTRTRLAFLHRPARRQPPGIRRPASPHARTRARGLERPQWTLDAFLTQPSSGQRLPCPSPGSTASPKPNAVSLDNTAARNPRSNGPNSFPNSSNPSVSPGAAPLSSAEHQAAPPLAASRRILRRSWLRRPPHPLARVSLRPRAHPRRDPLRTRVPRRSHPDRRPRRVRRPHCRRRLVPRRKRKRLARRRHNPPAAAA